MRVMKLIAGFAVLCTMPAAFANGNKYVHEYLWGAEEPPNATFGTQHVVVSRMPPQHMPARYKPKKANGKIDKTAPSRSVLWGADRQTLGWGSNATVHGTGAVQGLSELGFTPNAVIDPVNASPCPQGEVVQGGASAGALNYF